MRRGRHPLQKRRRSPRPGFLDRRLEDLSVRAIVPQPALGAERLLRQSADRALQGVAERAAKHRAVERHQSRGPQSAKADPKAQVRQGRQAVDAWRSCGVDGARNHCETITEIRPLLPKIPCLGTGLSATIHEGHFRRSAADATSVGRSKSRSDSERSRRAHGP